MDDDDYLIADGFVAALKRCVEEEHKPDVVFVKMDVSGTAMPDFSEGLRRGWIACSCFAIKRGVWLEHVMDFIDDYSADFHFIEAIMNCARNHTQVHLNMIASRVG
ncbi:MAG TPA: hypothetical protein VII92_14460, partial [Anaerolineae bacterium]